MKIGFIGAGKVGCALGSYFKKNGKTLCGYYSRSFSSAKSAASFTGSVPYESLPDLLSNSDIVFVTVPDSAITDVWKEIRAVLDQAGVPRIFDGKILCHCSGSQPSSLFEDADAFGIAAFSVHPLCAFADRFREPPGISSALFTAEGSERKQNVISSLINSCGNPIQWIEGQDKIRYHAGAVFASNLAVGLYDAAFRILESTGFSPENAVAALSPLIRGNVESVLNQGPAAALTGPIERNDCSTVVGHLAVLSEEEAALYRVLSERLITLAAQKHSDTDYSSIAQLLKGDNFS